MFIQTEKTPNPEVLKFIPGEPVLKKGTAEFKSADDAAHSPLAQRFFRLDGVQSVFFGPDFISITKAPEKDWAILKTQLLAAIMEHFSANQPIVDDQSAGPVTASGHNNEIVDQICELLETRVRPAVQQDGGDIVFDKFEDGIVYLHMRGACSGCPSSSMTLKSGIENMLRHFVPEVIEVRASNAL